MTTEQYYYLSAITMIISAALALFGLIFACIQLWQIRKNRQKQFDQLRREKTVEMVIHYVNSINRETKITEKIVSKFNDDQCLDLYTFNSFPIDEQIKDKICEICPYKQTCDKTKDIIKCKGDDGKYYIKDDILYFLREKVITHLNNLESVLLSWQLGIVEKSVIEEQFIFLDKKREKERALEVFRSIAGGGQSYPAIERFYQHLNKLRNEQAERSLKNVLK